VPHWDGFFSRWQKRGAGETLIGGDVEFTPKSTQSWLLRVVFPWRPFERFSSRETTSPRPAMTSVIFRKDPPQDGQNCPLHRVRGTIEPRPAQTASSRDSASIER
jgi:hypothetical protein